MKMCFLKENLLSFVQKMVVSIVNFAQLKLWRMKFEFLIMDKKLNKQHINMFDFKNNIDLPLTPLDIQTTN